MSEIYDTCGDDRFELIAKAKQKLLDTTNIESRPEEIAVLDSVLFRCWQMGWLDKLRDADTRWHELFGTPERAANTVLALQVCPMSKDECEECPAYDVCFEYYKDGRTVYEMAKWLRGYAE